MSDQAEKLMVRIGRLLRRIDKLTKQRDHFRAQAELRQEMINIAPYVERRWKTYNEMIAEQKRIEGLEQRVKEQTLLIEQLTGTERD